jgi:hypothetical protein
LQQLFHERLALRFDHLTIGHGPEDALWKSFSSMSNIFKRIDAQWKDVEEDALKMNNVAYADMAPLLRHPLRRNESLSGRQRMRCFA